MIHVLIIVPYPELVDKTCKILDIPKYKDAIDATIQLMTVDKVDQVISSGYDLIIARGYTAVTLSQKQNVPILPLPITTLDILHAIIDCRDTLTPTPRKIGCVGRGNEFESLNSLTDVLNIPIYISTTSTYMGVEQCVQDAIDHGCDAIVGGYSAFLAAQDKDIPGFFVRTGEEAITQVLDDAIRIIEASSMQQFRNEIYKTVIRSSTNAILYVDNQERIIIENQQALSLTRKKTLKTRSLQQMLPFMDATYREVLSTGKAVSNEIQQLYDQTISIEYIPILIREKVDGVLISFQDITQIQKQEATIRKNLSDKGLRAKYTFRDVIHNSDIMNTTIEKAHRFAETSSNIMLLGESGTGKELFAQSIHNCSKRKDGPFVAINCAALPENLLESELFGYVQGAFTGTNKGGKIGLFELAHGGTLFLDEISEVSINVQSKLLRVLQEREVRRIGDDKVISVDVRIICATNQNLKKLIVEGRFRQDLLYRLDVLRVFLPPLRRREKDVLLIFSSLLRHYLPDNVEELPPLTPEAQELLLFTPFPGNVRELRNVAERVSVLHNFPDAITADELTMALYPEDIDSDDHNAFFDAPAAPVTPSHASSEAQAIQDALKECNGNQTKAARLLGIDRSTLWRKLKKYNLNV